MAEDRLRWGRAKGTPNKATEISRKLFEEAFEEFDYNPFAAHVYAAEQCLIAAENASPGPDSINYYKAFRMLNKDIIDKFVSDKKEIELTGDVDLIALAPKVILPEGFNEEDNVERNEEDDESKDD